MIGYPGRRSSVLYLALRERHVRPPSTVGPARRRSLASAWSHRPQATAAGWLLDLEPPSMPLPAPGRHMPLENCTANTSIFINCRCICNFQATKSQR